MFIALAICVGSALCLAGLLHTIRCKFLLPLLPFGAVVMHIVNLVKIRQEHIKHYILKVHYIRFL